jgi:hypothetical protein
MKPLPLLAAVAIVVLKGADVAAAAELPTYESMGLPITAVQASVLEPAHVQEVSRQPALTLDGMPASPHQIAVLTPRRHVVGELATKPATGSRAR